MSTTKMIFIGIVALALLAFLAYIAIDKSAPAAIIGGLTTIWGAIEAKLFGDRKTKDKIFAANEAKQAEWSRVKEDFEHKYSLIQARLDYLAVKSATISQKLSSLDVEEKKALEKIDKMTAEEKEKFAKDILEKLGSRP